ncbi:MAG: electron transfer flavoprotein subunit beta/FixA family protein [Oceanococcaceae bacterium]
MKVLVPIKRAVDYNVRIRVKGDGSGVELNGVKMSVNPFDEIANEEALRLREKGVVSEVIVCTIGTAKAEDQLRSELARGADRAIHVVTDEEIQPLQAARILAKLAQDEGAELILGGKQAIDDDANQTGQMTATLLGWAQATFASKVEIADGKATVDREIDAGIETLEVDLPAVITADLRLNEPRFIKLPDIMKAKKKPLEKKELSDFDIDVPKLQVTKTAAPGGRAPGRKVKDVAELVAALKDKGLV